MAATIKLTMLGGSKTGKTCYLVGMYGIMRKGTNGFTFAAADLDDDLVLGQQWKTLRTKTGEKRWPPPTTATKNLEFDFCYGYKPFRRFAWQDYRGGALHSMQSDPDFQGLVAQLADSSCVLFCFSAEHLTDPEGRVPEAIDAIKALEHVEEGEGKTTRMKEAIEAVAEAIEISDDGIDESHRMNMLMTDVARKAQESGRPLPAVVIVLTKYDLIAGWPEEAVLEKVRDQFSALFAKGGKWTVTTCPVSLGRALKGNADGGKIDAINVERPVAFAVYLSIRQAAAQADRNREAGASALELAQSMSRLGRWLKRVDLTSLADEINRSQGEREELSQQLDVLFREMIKGLTIFHNGKEIEFSD